MNQQLDRKRKEGFLSLYPEMSLREIGLELGMTSEGVAYILREVERKVQRRLRSNGIHSMDDLV